MENLDKKILFSEWDYVISENIELGNSFFAITINFKDEIIDEEKFNEKIEVLFKLIKKNTNALTFMYVVNETCKNNKIRIHGVIAIKNITDHNVNLKNNITNLLEQEYGSDIVVKTLKDFINIKNWITGYLLKEINLWKYNSVMYFLSDKQQIFADLFDLTEYELKIKNNFKMKLFGFKNNI